MNGITIVEEHLCRVVELPAFIGLGIFMTLLCVGTLLLYRFMYKHSSLGKNCKITIIVCSILVVIICVVFWVAQTINYNITHMEYTITIDDSVSFNDFHAKYAIVSVNEDEYRVVEK